MSLKHLNFSMKKSRKNPLIDARLTQVASVRIAKKWLTTFHKNFCNKFILAVNIVVINFFCTIT